MNSSQNAFFFEIQQILEDSKIFDELKNQQVYFFYFQVNQKYYLFFYQQKSIDIDRIEPLIHILDELDRKQRKIRSLRGFFLYVLQIMENGQDYQILKTNLQPSFWRKLKSIIRQNKKIVLLQFLFGSQDSIAEPDTQNHLNEKIERLQNQVNFLQQKVIQLEQNQIIDLKYARRGTLESPEVDKLDSNMLSKALKSPLYLLSKTQQYNLSSNQEKGVSEANFITLARIPEEQKIEIIKTGFQRQAEGKISLKKYYEGTETHSLFQLKGYSIKYESIRRTKLYQQLKE